MTPQTKPAISPLWFTDRINPGIIRLASDTTVAILVGMRAPEFVKALNNHDALLEALKLGPDTEHAADERGPCLCSQCEFVRAKRAAIHNAEQS